jgi:hypothetical protein
MLHPCKVKKQKKIDAPYKRKFVNFNIEADFVTASELGALREEEPLSLFVAPCG